MQISSQPAKESHDSYRYQSTQQYDVYIFSTSIRFPRSQAHESQRSPISGMLITGKSRGQVFYFPPQNLTCPLGSPGDTRGRSRMPSVTMAMSCASLPMSLFSSPHKRSLVTTRSHFHSSSLMHLWISTVRTRRTSRPSSRRTSKTAARIWAASSGKRIQFATARLQRNSLPHLAVDQSSLWSP